jgi:hypothetical protein
MSICVFLPPPINTFATNGKGQALTSMGNIMAKVLIHSLN